MAFPSANEVSENNALQCVSQIAHTNNYFESNCLLLHIIPLSRYRNPLGKSFPQQVPLHPAPPPSSRHESHTIDTECSADMLLGALQVGLKGQPPVLEGKFSKPVQPDECLWSLDNGSIEMTLQKADRMTWWSSIVEGEPAIDTSKVTSSPTGTTLSLELPWKMFD